ncbi:uncharacterized protein A4U43_C03F8760 [Asparagus officinalis]|uniref:Cyclin N-terminal domain-containing protein n=1 Tax=Asparagus officinalis TaxID=4686 RepID=A0A5P1F970_ASPOF|nr:cyclin-D6-1 [Asparagus officinalis]ONK74654.1 uncharacterized protein A4U43_C03F8760 [Asparagus officinalis]
MEFDLENPLISNEDDLISDLFAAESDHMSSFAGNVTQASRQNAVSLIIQAQFTWNLDPFLSYLAVNYIDRFLSKREIPSGKPWIERLLTIACLSLASKMKKVDFCLADLQRDEGFIFDGQTIHRMEMLVLGTLEWRMRSITPFCFINYFIAFFKPDQLPYLEALKNRALETLFLAQNEIKILEFKPSLIAASALLSAANELFPIQFNAFKSAISASEFVHKEKLSECLSVMIDVAMDSCESTFEMISSSNTPVTVLRGAHDLSATESDLTVGSKSDDRNVKKRRTAAALSGLRLKPN